MPAPKQQAAMKPSIGVAMPSMRTALAARQAPANPTLALMPMRRANSAKPSTASADVSENVLTMVAATVELSPRSMRCGAWCRLTPACTG